MKIKDYLIIADIHIGISYQLRVNGISIPKQAEKMASRIIDLVKTTKSKHLVILGDIKHSIPGTPSEERDEIEKFFELLNREKIDITVIKGNHDGMIERLVPENVKIKKSVVIGNYMLTHGHRKINTKQKNIVIGHNHPIIKFKDDLGSVYFEPVWIRYNGDNYNIIMPAFNDVSGGHVFNSKKPDTMGPIAKQIELDKTHAFLLDGTDLGHVSDLIIE